MSLVALVPRPFGYVAPRMLISVTVAGRGLAVAHVLLDRAPAVGRRHPVEVAQRHGPARRCRQDRRAGVVVQRHDMPLPVRVRRRDVQRVACPGPRPPAPSTASPPRTQPSRPMRARVPRRRRRRASSRRERRLRPGRRRSGRGRSCARVVVSRALVPAERPTSAPLTAAGDDTSSDGRRRQLLPRRQRVHAVQHGAVRRDASQRPCPPSRSAPWSTDPSAGTPATTRARSARWSWRSAVGASLGLYSATARSPLASGLLNTIAFFDLAITWPWTPRRSWSTAMTSVFL